jgi:hypothetical protein
MHYISSLYWINMPVHFDSCTEHFCIFRCKITNKSHRCCKLLLYSSNYPDMFRQLNAIFRGLQFFASYSSIVCASGGCGLWFGRCGQLPRHSVDTTVYGRMRKKSENWTCFLSFSTCHTTYQIIQYQQRTVTILQYVAYICIYIYIYIQYIHTHIQVDQKVSVHLMITVQQTRKNILNSFSHLPW